MYALSWRTVYVPSLVEIVKSMPLEKGSTRVPGKIEVLFTWEWGK